MLKIFNNKGNAAILLTFIITGLLGFTALTVDIGMAYVERTSLSNALDAAVLAASLELHNGETNAKEVAKEFLKKNNVNPDDVNIQITINTIEITGKKNVKHFFAPIIGIKDSDVTGRAKALIGPVGSVRGGVRPFAVEMFDYTFGDRVVLKADTSERGNYRVVALGGSGSSTFLDNALNGYSGIISIGDRIQTEPGNMAGASNQIRNHINSENSTFDNFPRDSIRLWTIPLVASTQLTGRTDLEVVAFGQFFVESVQQRGGKLEFTGRFVRFVTNGIIDMDAPDTGTYAVKLSR